MSCLSDEPCLAARISSNHVSFHEAMQQILLKKIMLMHNQSLAGACYYHKPKEEELFFNHGTNN